MASNRKGKATSNWFAEVLIALMQENKVSSRALAEKVDRSVALVNAVIDGSHVPSILLAEQLVQALGHDIEVMVKKDG